MKDFKVSMFLCFSLVDLFLCKCVGFDYQSFGGNSRFRLYSLGRLSQVKFFEMSKVWSHFIPTNLSENRMSGSQRQVKSRPIPNYCSIQIPDVIKNIWIKGNLKNGHWSVTVLQISLFQGKKMFWDQGEKFIHFKISLECWLVSN